MLLSSRQLSPRNGQRTRGGTCARPAALPSSLGARLLDALGVRQGAPNRAKASEVVVTEAEPQASTPKAETSLRLQCSVLDSIAKVSPEEWDAVATSCMGGEVNPFVRHSFLLAMEESGSATARTGWLPQHIVVRAAPEPDESNTAGSSSNTSGGAAAGTSGQQGRVLGVVPLYLKGHSYGEYVFDSSWAQASSMMGIRYYPKMQTCVPFTPVTGPRLMVDGRLGPNTRAQVVRSLGRVLKDMADSSDVSGVHLTFTSAQEYAVLGELGFKQRLGIQFHWDNGQMGAGGAPYESFEEFLATLKQSKRKSIRQERKAVANAGLQLHRLSGSELNPEHWDRFHDFYLATVEKKWGNAYLTRDFWHRLGEAMPEEVLLVAASEGSSTSSSMPSCSNEAPEASSLVAGALNLVGSHALYGRNWGCAEGREVKGLHFEACFYQAIEEAIQRRLPRVEAGAQGEHKLSRGYTPSFVYSCHYLCDPRLEGAVDTFLKRERSQIEYTLQALSLQASPYKKERTLEVLMHRLHAYNSLSSSSSSIDEEAAASIDADSS